MFGFRFVKVQPTTFLLQYQNGRVVRQGVGLSFFYFAPTSSLVAVPIASTDVPFVFKEVTADLQEVTIQGQVTYRIADPEKVSQLLNFTLDASAKNYVSDDPQKLSQRVISIVQVLTRAELQNLKLREALKASDTIVQHVNAGLTTSTEINSLGVQILGLVILAVQPNPDTARALEAEAREQLLREADEAIYSRRNSAVDQERAIKENELNTEIAVENKKRQIREAQMDADYLFYTVREPFPSKTSSASLVLGKITREQPLELVSATPEGGVVFSDGIESDYIEFNSGTRATITLAEKQGHLVI